MTNEPTDEEYLRWRQADYRRTVIDAVRHFYALGRQAGIKEIVEARQVCVIETLCAHKNAAKALICSECNKALLDATLDATKQAEQRGYERGLKAGLPKGMDVISGLEIEKLMKMKTEEFKDCNLKFTSGAGRDMCRIVQNKIEQGRMETFAKITDDHNKVYEKGREDGRKEREHVLCSQCLKNACQHEKPCRMKKAHKGGDE